MFFTFFKFVYTYSSSSNIVSLDPFLTILFIFISLASNIMPMKECKYYIYVLRSLLYFIGNMSP